MDSKTQFINQKELREWWVSISGDSRFDAVLLYAAAITLETCPSAEQREGVIYMKEVLLTMGDKMSEAPDFPSPGLNHNLETQRRTLETDNQKTK